MSELFYVVWSPQGGNPTEKHISLAEAQAEAERLAANNPGRPFHVLELAGTAVSANVNWFPARGRF